MKSIFTFITLSISIMSTAQNLLEDKFEGNQIDNTIWAKEGSGVYQSDGIMKLVQDVTDRPTNLYSKWVSFDATKPIIISRKVKVRYGSDYYYGNMTLQFNNEPSGKSIAVQYLRTKYYDNGYKDLKDAVQLNFKSKTYNEVPITSNIFGEWFDELLKYNPQDGFVEYYRNGMLIKKIQSDITFNRNGSVRVVFSPFGWWQNHSHFFDDFVLSQNENGISSKLTSAQASKTDNNNKDGKVRTDGIYIFKCSNFLDLDLLQYNSKTHNPNESSRFSSWFAIKFESATNAIFYYNRWQNPHNSIDILGFDNKDDLLKSLSYCEKYAFNPNQTLQLNDNYQYGKNWGAEQVQHTFSIIDVDANRINLNYHGVSSYKYGTKTFVRQDKYSDNITGEFNLIYDYTEAGIKAINEKNRLIEIENDKKRIEQERIAKLKAAEDNKRAIQFEKNRIAALQKMNEGDRVCWSQGWQSSESFFGVKYNVENYKMNVICYVEKKVGDRYQIRVASIKSNSSHWAYPLLNGVELKENTLHWIKPSDYINNPEWHYAE